MKIITTADDFGACNFIDQGVIEGLDAKVVSCVSAFVNFKKRTGAQRGGAYSGSVAAIKALKAKYNVPVGLHLTIHTGNPASNGKDLGMLVHKEDPSKANSAYLFNPIENFKPADLRKKAYINQVTKEVEAQLKVFEKHFGTPNHISCHFGVVFQFPEILERVLSTGKFKGIPIRNPILGWQTPVSKSDPHKKEIKKFKSKFKTSSQMKVEGLRKGLKWANRSMSNLLKVANSVASKKKRLNLLMDNDIRFPEYTHDYFYKNNNWKGFDYLLNNMLTVVPGYYKHGGEKTTATNEIILHLGGNDLPPLRPNESFIYEAPAGINSFYFPKRQVELRRLIGASKQSYWSKVKLVTFKDIKP